MASERFPGVLGEIAEAAGEEAALKIGAAYGGTRKGIPATARPGSHWLTDCVGRDAADAICKYFRQLSPGGRERGVYLLIPRGDEPNSELHQKIIELSDGGMSASKIARLLKVTERTVYRHRAIVRRKTRSRLRTRPLWLPRRGER